MAVGRCASVSEASISVEKLQGKGRGTEGRVDSEEEEEEKKKGKE